MGYFRQVSDLAPAWVPSWVYALLLFAAILAAGLVLQAAITRFLSRQPPDWHVFGRKAWHRTRRLLRFMLALFAAGVSLQLVDMSRESHAVARHIFGALFTVQLGWIVLTIVNIAMDRYLFRFHLDAKDNLLARKAVTQMRMVRRAVNVVLILLTVGFALMSFDGVRQFGISLFASAGVAGIVAALAARPLLENLIAGLQLAFTQPVRIGDAVEINNETGTVEEIGSVYIVIKLWDWRRQVVPLSYLFQNPFTNWTRSGSSIIGAVMIYVDYTLPMDAVRAKALELVKRSPLWDGQVASVQVTDARDQVMEVRVLASAADSGRSWDLRCEVREKLIAYIRDEFPYALPRVRREDFRLTPETAASQDGPSH
jgi:small-conductance mechanosensitive channel